MTRIAKLLITSSIFAWGSPALAQQAPPAPEAGEDSQADGPTIIVTGTNTRRPAADAMVPVQVVDRQEIVRTGAAQLSDVLRTIPSNTGTALYNETGQLSGTAQFELRGLGFSSTLVLLNGRRAGVAPLSDRSGADFLDINQFPLSMISRIDVLKDGASAIYGSEAVAGVVNIITRRGFEGVELSGEYQNSTNDAYGLNLAVGARSERATFNFYGSYYHQTGNVRTDFDWIIERIGGNGVPGRSQLLSGNGYPGTYSQAGFDAAGRPVPISGAPTTPDPGCEAAGGVFAIRNDGSVDRNTCRFDFVDQIGVIPAVRRLQAFVELDYALTEALSFFNETSAARNINYIYKQPGGFSNGAIAGTGNVFIPADHPFNFFVADPTRPNGIRYVDPAQWNPATDVAVPLVGNVRPEGTVFDGRKRQQNTYFRTVNGLRLEGPAEWIGTVSHQYALARFDEEDPVRFNAAAINRLLVSGEYNPFSTSVLSPGLVSPKDPTRTAANSDAVTNQIFYTSTTVRRTEQNVVDFNATGPILTPPTGEISLALGAQYRRLTLRAVPDSLAAAGGADSPATDSTVSGRQEVKSAYAELVVPWRDIAELQLAVRHDAYDGAVGSSTDPKVAGRVNVLDQLAVRGSWGTSFQAPTLTQTSTSQAFQIINDPVVLTPQGLACGSTPVGNNVLVTTQGGNLRPQSSRNLTAGLDARPVRGLRLTADYWRYNYRDLIAAGQNGQAIVNGQCAGGQYVPDPRVARGASGQLFGITTTYVNVGRVVTDGFDLSMTYALPTESLGTFRFRADATYVNNFDVVDASGASTEKAGSRNFTNNFAPIPRWRASGAAAWDHGPHRVSIGIQYTDGYRNDQSNNAPISSFTTVDAQYSARLARLIGMDTTLTLGVNNLFDRDPPSLIRYDAGGNLITGTVSDVDRPAYDPLAGADIRGRLFYVRLSQAF